MSVGTDFMVKPHTAELWFLYNYLQGTMKHDTVRGTLSMKFTYSF